MIAHVIMMQQLGGYTKRTFPLAIDGHRVEQVAFSKFVLRKQVIVLFPNLLLMRNQSDTLHLSSAKAYAVHYHDVLNGLIKLLCTHSEVE
jgi:hypothetical protein